MKLKTTNREIRSGSRIVLKVGYCTLQSLLRNKSPFAYGAGKYGWNYDAYDLGGGITLTTGYGPIGAALNYNMVRRFEGLAEKTWANSKALERVYKRFVKELVKLVDA